MPAPARRPPPVASVVARPDPAILPVAPDAKTQVADMTSDEKMAALADVPVAPAGGDAVAPVARVDELLPAVAAQAAEPGATYETQKSAHAAVTTAHKVLQASGPVGGDEAAARHAASLEALAKTADEIKARMDAMNAPKPRDMDYGQPAIKYSPENWIHDRPARDDPPARWAMPDPRLLQFAYDDWGDAGSTPSRAMQDVGLNPYGYLRQRELKRVDDTLAIDGRPTTGLAPDEGFTDVAAQYAVFAGHVAGRVMYTVDDIKSMIRGAVNHAARRREDARSSLKAYGNSTLRKLREAKVEGVFDAEGTPTAVALMFVVHALLSWMGHEDLGQSAIYAQPGDPDHAYDDRGTNDEWMNDFTGRVDNLDAALSEMETAHLVFLANLLLPVDRDVHNRLDAYATLMEFYLQLGTVTVLTEIDGDNARQPVWQPYDYRREDQ